MNPSQYREYLCKTFNYDAGTGTLTRTSPRYQKWKDRPVGTKSSHGYLVVNVGGRTDYVHRIAWIITHGAIPDGNHIDHKDRNRSNNKLENLRSVLPRENAWNSVARCTSRSGIKGVHWSTSANQWVSQIQICSGERIHLGCFSTLAGAKKARKSAEKVYQTSKPESVV